MKTANKTHKITNLQTGKVIFIGSKEQCGKIAQHNNDKYGEVFLIVSLWNCVEQVEK